MEEAQSKDLKVGIKVEVEDDNGNPLVGTVTQLTDQEVTVDANHPLAGKTLVFDIELIEFRSHQPLLFRSQLSSWRLRSQPLCECI